MEKITAALLIVSYIISGLAVAMNLNLVSIDTKGEINLLNNPGDNNCSELDVFTTSECLNAQLKTWYKYNLSNTGKNLSFEMLKEEGGVCRHFSDWYKQSLLKLGAVELSKSQLKYLRNDSSLYITEVIIPVDEITNHVFLMVSGKDGECKLDNELINCWSFANDTS